MNDSNGHKDHALSRIYREGAWPEPGRQIDQAILAASRRAAREHSFVRRWAPSFAVAATVVLTSTLVLKAYREQPEVISPSVPDKAEPARARQAAPAAEPKVAEAKPTSPPPAPQPPRGFTSTMDSGEAERLDRLQHDLGLKQSPPPSESRVPAPKSGPADKAADAALKKEAVTRAEASQRAVTRPVLPHTQNMLPAARQEPVQPQASGVDPMQAQSTRPAPVSVPAPADAAPPSPAASADSTSGNALGATVAERIASKAAERSPQAWLEDIRKLVAEGKLEQADRELADFKKRHPDFAVPSDLR